MANSSRCTARRLAAGLLAITCASGPAHGAQMAMSPACRSPESASYDYPYADPYLATVTAAVLNVEGPTPGTNRQVVHVPVLPGRNRLPSLEGRGELSVALYRQGRPAPLLFVVPGIGSSAYFGLGVYVAELFHADGFHVVVLPSPMSWNFALAASRTGAPGYTPDDARDLYRAMQSTLRLLRARYALDITRIAFLGASLGALEGAYLSVLDAQERAIGIDEYLLVNPPLDLSYALEKLDQWRALGESAGRGSADELQRRARAIVDAYARDRFDDPAALGTLAARFSEFTTEELQLLIAYYASGSLPELVYVTQAIHDRHVLVAPRADVRARLQEAKAFSMTDYWRKIGEPSWMLPARPVGLENASDRSSLPRVLGQIRGNPRVQVIHNLDDIFSDPGAIEQLRDALPGQVTLYPSGGHLGNLWYPPVRRCIVLMLRGGPLAEPPRASS